MITDITYFINLLEIPNTDDNNTTINNVDKLNAFIKQYEYEYLLECFGFEQAKDIVEKVNPDGTIKGNSPSNQKYIDLIDGVGNWKGLRYEINGHKYSQLANYVFCKYLELGELELTELGTLYNALEQGFKRSNKYFHNKAWRFMIKERQLTCEYYDYMYYNQNNRQTLTLQQYITESTDWDSNYFNYWENSNQLDL